MKQVSKIIRGIMLIAAICAGITAVADNSYPNVSITPEPGVVKHLSEFEMTFVGNWGLGTYRSRAITITGPEGVELPKVRNYSTGTSYIIYFEDDAIVTAPGEYTLIIPEGKFAIGNDDLQEMRFTYTIESNETPAEFPSYTIFPEEGEYEIIDQSFRITFDTDETIAVKRSMVGLYGPDGYVPSSVSLATNGEAMILVTPVNAVDDVEPLTLPGKYTLVFETNSIIIGDTTNDKPLIFEYTIAGDPILPWTGEITADPEDNSVVDRLQHITVKFAGREVTVSERATPNQFPAVYDKATHVQVTGCTAYAEGNVLELSLNNAVAEKGSYSLIIPKQFITIDRAHPEQDIVLNYTIEGPAEAFTYTYTVTPEEGSILGSTESITLTIEAQDLKSVANDIFAWGTTAPHFTNAMGASNPTLLVSSENNTFTFSHNWPFDTDGEYTLVIPANYFTITNTKGETVKNSIIAITYFVGTSSIESLVAEGETVDVFNVSGVNVAKDADINSLKTLPAGLYIINGKKLLIK